MKRMAALVLALAVRVPAGLLALAIGQGVGVGGEGVEYGGAYGTGRRRARKGPRGRSWRRGLSPTC